MPPVELTLAAAVVGLVHLGAYYGRRPVLAGVTKAVPVALALAWAITCAPAVTPAYRTLVAIGLVFGMGGDLCLLWPAWFRAGLASFFVGHVAYVLAFTAGSPGAVRAWLWLAPLALVAGGVLLRLWPHVARERGPVAAYVIMIAAMAWFAIGRALGSATPAPSGLLAALGAGIFMVSDTVLAFDRFARPWSGAHALVMVTYYAAQWLVAASVAA